MTGPGRVRSQHAHEEWALQRLPLPGHVIVLTNAGWRRGWLIARENGLSGWIGYTWAHTRYHDDIASPDMWVARDPSAASDDHVRLP